MRMLLRSGASASADVSADAGSGAGGASASGFDAGVLLAFALKRAGQLRQLPFGNLPLGPQRRRQGGDTVGLGSEGLSGLASFGFKMPAVLAQRQVARADFRDDAVELPHSPVARGKRLLELLDALIQPGAAFIRPGSCSSLLVRGGRSSVFRRRGKQFGLERCDLLLRPGDLNVRLVERRAQLQVLLQQFGKLFPRPFGFLPQGSVSLRAFSSSVSRLGPRIPAASVPAASSMGCFASFRSGGARCSRSSVHAAGATRLPHGARRRDGGPDANNHFRE